MSGFEAASSPFAALANQDKLRATQTSSPICNGLLACTSCCRSYFHESVCQRGLDIVVAGEGGKPAPLYEDPEYLELCDWLYGG
jgi:hypothetical protein